MTWLISLFPEYRRQCETASRVIAFQDRVSELEAQNDLLRSQLEKAQASETQSVKQLANIMAQLQFRTKLFEDVPGLPEPKITEEDMRPVQNQHSFMYAQNNAQRESLEAIARWDRMTKQRHEERNRAQQQQEQQAPWGPQPKSLEELAAEIPAFQ